MSGAPIIRGSNQLPNPPIDLLWDRITNDQGIIYVNFTHSLNEVSTTFSVLFIKRIVYLLVLLV